MDDLLREYREAVAALTEEYAVRLAALLGERPPCRLHEIRLHRRRRLLRQIAEQLRTDAEGFAEGAKHQHARHLAPLLPAVDGRGHHAQRVR